jgi:hypothetical protein
MLPFLVQLLMARLAITDRPHWNSAMLFKSYWKANGMIIRSGLTLCGALR